MNIWDNALYVPIVNFSTYSMLQSTNRIDELVEKAKDYGYPALGLVDKHHGFGWLPFGLACIKHGIQPLFGCTLSLYGDGFLYEIRFVVQNQEGYKNLCRLISLSTQCTSTPFESVSIDHVRTYHHGLMLLCGSVPHGLLYQALYSRKTRLHESLLEIFADRFCAEMQRYDDERLQQYEPLLLEWCMKKRVPVVPTNEAFFLDEDDYESHDALICIKNNAYIDDDTRPKSHPDHFFKSPTVIADLFKDVPEALLNTINFAKKCSFLLKPRKPQLPHFTEENEHEMLCKQSFDGLRKRLQERTLSSLTDEDYKKRLQEELHVIGHTGFSGYFLIVSDFIRYAKKHHIPVGPGRGSGAGSLVAWCLDITDIDPMVFGLFFERFLNPERVSLPDFDIDFCQHRREEVIAYVQKKYGQDRVAHIITFGSLQARAVIRDVGRVCGMPYPKVDAVCKMIPHNPTHPVTLSQAVDQDPALKALQDGDDDNMKRLFRTCLKLEGLFRHASVHAGGVVIAKEPLHHVLPVYKDPDNPLHATEFSMKYVEAMGLVKFDFLGLKTLTVLVQTQKIIKDVLGKDVDVRYIPLDDEEVFAFLNKGHTVGVFQLESSGMTDTLVNMQLSRFEDIIALVALYRPGPMDEIPRFIACKRGEALPEYMYQEMKPILEETYGVVVYQEQVMHIAQRLAGYTLGGADLLRRAMGKKIQEEMEKQRSIFVQGILRTIGGTDAKAGHLFDQIAKFASYAFNKAHAASYALISYQTAYVKTHYPWAYLTALINNDSHNVDKVMIFVDDARHLGIPVLGPCIQHSRSLCYAFMDDDSKKMSIRYGLSIVRNIGSSVEHIVRERLTKGAFASLDDFVARCHEYLNKKILESLIFCGALDIFGVKRGRLLVGMDQLLQGPIGINLFQETLYDTLPEVDDFTSEEASSYEYDAFGYYFYRHPLEPFKKILSQWKGLRGSHLEHQEEGMYACMGVVLDTKEKKGKKNKYMFLMLSDPHDRYDIMVFGEDMGVYRNLFQKKTTFFFLVNVRRTANRALAILHKAIPTDALFDSISLNIHDHEHKILQKLLDGYTSSYPGLLYVYDEVGCKKAFTMHDAPLSAELAHRLKIMFPHGNVRVSWKHKSAFLHDF